MRAVKPSGIITLLTDFGLDDPFVGNMKGVILDRFREATIVDLTHRIPPQDIAAASFWINRSFDDFPEGTVHVVVVDPTVGTERMPIVIESEAHYFIAPDNGVLGPLSKGEVRRIDRKMLAAKKSSHTFHGRDVFAPAAALLASGSLWASELGPPATPQAEPVRLEAAVESGRIVGRIVVVDRFGNLLSNIDESALSGLSGPLRVRFGDHELPLVRTYAEVAPDEPLALVDAFGVVELAVRNGDARARLGLQVGGTIEVLGADG